MTHDTLISIIEKLAVDFVLIEHTDTEELEEITPYFSQIATWASDNSQHVLGHAATGMLDLANQIINGTSEYPEQSMGMISQTISEIQIHARNEFDFSRATFPEEIIAAPPPAFTEPAPDNQQKEETAATHDPDRKPLPPDTPPQKPEPSATGVLRHPATLPGHIDNALFAEFLSMQPDVLNKMEELILSIEQGNITANINELKRLIHTTKGEAGFLNLDDVETICHHTEDILEGDAPELHTDLFFAVIDWIRNTFSWYQGNNVPQPDPANTLLTLIDGAINNGMPAPEAPTETIDIIAIINDIKNTLGSTPTVLSMDMYFLYRKFIVFTDDIYEEAVESLKSLKENQTSGEVVSHLQTTASKINTLSSFLSLPELSYLSKETLTLLSNTLSTTGLQTKAVADIVSDSFLCMRHFNQKLETAVSQNTDLNKDDEIPYMIARIRASLSGIILEAQVKKNDGDPPDKNREINGKPMEKALSADKVEPSQRSAELKGSGPVKESINVDAERLDRIIDMIGELVIAESMVIQAEEIKNIESQEITRHLAHMDKITRGLQETGLSLRMLPIKATFTKMARVARDTAKKSGKTVRFDMSGEETELDKTVVDKIGDPLMHMVRNSIDHGIEDSVRRRIEKGKPEHGTVTMRAFHKGGNIHIEIEDDGRGLDRNAILEKAIDRGLVSDETVLSDREIYSLIFEPGFSTAEEVTDISGRGVGMNVVKTGIEALHGQVDIKSEWNKGSIFTIKIPLTLAIIDGMVVKVGDERYIIPTLSIITSNKIEKKDITSVFDKGDMVDVQGQLVPLFILSRLFNGNNMDDVSGNSLMVVVEEEDRQAALVVDELLGKQQIVIKSLGESMQNIPGISGAAIMPDGKVGLIIDVAGLVKFAHNRSHAGAWERETRP